MGQVLNNQAVQLFLDLLALIGGYAAILDLSDRWKARSQRRSQGASAQAIAITKPSIKNSSARIAYGGKGSGFGKGLMAAFPWAFTFAVIGEYLLVAVVGLSHSSVTYTLLIVLFWAAGIPVGLIVRSRSQRFTVLVTILGVVALITTYAILAHGNMSYMSK